MDRLKVFPNDSCSDGVANSILTMEHTSKLKPMHEPSAYDTSQRNNHRMNVQNEYLTEV